MFYPFLKTGNSKWLLTLNAALALFYFITITFFFQKGNSFLFWLLITGEVFHLWQVLSFIHTTWWTKRRPMRDVTFLPSVDVFITVAGEPRDVVFETLQAALAMQYPHFKVYVLNDGYVAGKENWREAEELAERFGAICITRTTPGGAKAGNINHALQFTQNPFIAFFDADHVPKKNFLKKILPYFKDDRLAFVQTPQFYKNSELNSVTRGSWEQQSLFFGAICKGKNASDAVALCGTNMVIRREALLQVGGMYEGSIAEDLVTGFFMHKNGWHSLYLPNVLAEGLAPEDFLAYSKQQARWARGGLDLLFRHNLLFTRGLTFAQRLEYLSSVSFFLTGWVVVIDAAIPLIFLFTGLSPLHTSTMVLASVFLPYMFVTLYMIQRSCNFSFTFRSLAFSLSSFNIHIKASIASLLHLPASFSITPKRGRSGNYLFMVIPHLLYIPVFCMGVGVALAREGFSSSTIANIMWGVTYIAIFSQAIEAALPQEVPTLRARRLSLEDATGIRTPAHSSRDQEFIS